MNSTVEYYIIIIRVISVYLKDDTLITIGGDLVIS